MRMVKLTLLQEQANKTVHLVVDKIVYMQPVAGAGTIITMVRGAVHVRQTVEQIMGLIDD